MYFSKFPCLEYPIPFENGLKYVLCRNIMRRCVLSSEMQDSTAVYIKYDVKEGERPEHIADKIYGDPELHWLILFSNNIIDPQNGWYKSSDVLEKYIQKKYNSFSLFFTDRQNNFLYDSSIGKSSKIIQSITGSNYSNIIDYKPTFACLEVDSSTISLGEAVIRTTGYPDIPINIKKKIASLYSVHHFEQTTETEKTILDPFLDPQTNSTRFENSYLYNYMFNQADQYVMSNVNYEQQKNEEKRTIKILHPSYKNLAMKQLESTMGV